MPRGLVDQGEIVVVVDEVAADDDAAPATGDVVDGEVIAVVVGVGDRPPGQERERRDAWNREVVVDDRGVRSRAASFELMSSVSLVSVPVTRLLHQTYLT